jgi:hypothetical protein
MITSPKTYASSWKLLWLLVPKANVSGHRSFNKIWSDWTHLLTTAL